MNKLKILLPIAIVIALFSSCLEYGLEELPAYDGAEITYFSFEFRGWDEEDNTLDIVRISSTMELDSANATIDLAVRLKGDATLQTLVGMTDISIAAKIRPLGNAPVLGVPGDFSQPNLQYEVIAADDKNKRIWTINVTEQ